MNTRRALIFAIGAALTFGPLAGTAQSADKTHRVGVLLSDALSGPAYSATVGALKQDLRDLGYVEGQSIEFEERAAAGDLKRFSELAAELLRLKIDLLVTSNTRAAQAAARLTRSVPIVVIGSGDLVGTGLAASLAKPGGNVTGLTSLSPELSAKRLELLKEIVPGLKRVAVLWNPDGPAPVRAFREVQIAARLLTLEIQSLEVRTPGDFERAFAASARARAQGMLVINDPLISGNVTSIVKLTTERRIPTVFPRRGFADAGGLIAYGPDYLAMYRRAAYFVDRILKGARASDMSIEQPAKFELIINAKAARALGVSVPMPVLSRADLVIQ